MIRFACPQCQTQLDAQEGRAGKTVFCPSCGRRCSVPAPSDAPVRTPSVPAPAPAAHHQPPPPVRARSPDPAPAATPRPAEPPPGVTVECPACHGQVIVPAKQLGSWVTCPGCGTGFAALGGAASGDEGESPLGGLDYPGGQDVSGYPGGQPEPWFFRYVQFYAYLMLALSIIGTCIALLVVLIVFVRIMAETREPLAAVMGAAGAVYLLLLLFGAIFSIAVVLLVLDMARSFRCLRSIADSLEERKR